MEVDISKPVKENSVFIEAMSAAAVTTRYEKGKMLGEGTWGSVYEAMRKGDGLQVAIKRIKPMDRSFQLGMNFTALREIKYLKQLNVPNVIKVYLKHTIKIDERVLLISSHYVVPSQRPCSLSEKCHF